MYEGEKYGREGEVACYRQEEREKKRKKERREQVPEVEEQSR